MTSSTLNFTSSFEVDSQCIDTENTTPKCPYFPKEVYSIQRNANNRPALRQSTVMATHGTEIRIPRNNDDSITAVKRPMWTPETHPPQQNVPFGLGPLVEQLLPEQSNTVKSSVVLKIKHMHIYGQPQSRVSGSQDHTLRPSPCPQAAHSRYSRMYAVPPYTNQNNYSPPPYAGHTPPLSDFAEPVPGPHRRDTRENDNNNIPTTRDVHQRRNRNNYQLNPEEVQATVPTESTDESSSTVQLPPSRHTRHLCPDANCNNSDFPPSNNPVNSEPPKGRDDRNHPDCQNIQNQFLYVVQPTDIHGKLTDGEEIDPLDDPANRSTALPVTMVAANDVVLKGTSLENTRELPSSETRVKENVRSQLLPGETEVKENVRDQLLPGETAVKENIRDQLLSGETEDKDHDRDQVQSDETKVGENVNQLCLGGNVDDARKQLENNESVQNRLSATMFEEADESGENGESKSVTSDVRSQDAALEDVDDETLISGDAPSLPRRCPGDGYLTPIYANLKNKDQPITDSRADLQFRSGSRKWLSGLWRRISRHRKSSTIKEAVSVSHMYQSVPDVRVQEPFASPEVPGLYLNVPGDTAQRDRGGDLDSEPWLWGMRDVSKDDAEQILKQSGNEGDFLFTNGDSLPGSMCILLVFLNGQVKGFPLGRDRKGRYYILTGSDKKCSCLCKLLKFYKKHSLPGTTTTLTSLAASRVSHQDYNNVYDQL